MPKSLDPNARLTMVLACDVDKPKETQPRIFGRVLTVSQQRRLLAAMQAMSVAESNEDKLTSALDAAEICIVGWENMIDPATGEAIMFGRDAIGDILTIDEMAEVFEFVASAATASGEDKKKSE